MGRPEIFYGTLEIEALEHGHDTEIISEMDHVHSCSMAI